MLPLKVRVSRLQANCWSGASLTAGRLVRLPGKLMDDGAYWLIWPEKKPRTGMARQVANWIRAEINLAMTAAAR